MAVTSSRVSIRAVGVDTGSRCRYGPLSRCRASQEDRIFECLSIPVEGRASDRVVTITAARRQVGVTARKHNLNTENNNTAPAPVTPGGPAARGPRPCHVHRRTIPADAAALATVRLGQWPRDWHGYLSRPPVRGATRTVAAAGPES